MDHAVGRACAGIRSECFVSVFLRKEIICQNSRKRIRQWRNCSPAGQAILSMDDSAVTDMISTNGLLCEYVHAYGDQQYFLLFQCGKWKYQPFL